MGRGREGEREGGGGRGREKEEEGGREKEEGAFTGEFHSDCYLCSYSGFSTAFPEQMASSLFHPVLFFHCIFIRR